MPHISRLPRIPIADGHVVVPNWEPTHLRLVCSRHGELSDFGARAVGAKDQGPMDGSIIAERCNYSVAALVESNVAEALAVLAKARSTVNINILFGNQYCVQSKKLWRQATLHVPEHQSPQHTKPASYSLEPSILSHTVRPQANPPFPLE